MAMAPTAMAAEDAPTKIAALFFLSRFSISLGWGELPNPCIFLFIDFVSSLCLLGGSSVGSGVPAMRACKTCRYNSAAGDSYFSLIVVVVEVVGVVGVVVLLSS
jgi:hypothetical protein